MTHEADSKRCALLGPLIEKHLGVPASQLDNLLEALGMTYDELRDKLMEFEGVRR